MLGMPTEAREDLDMTLRLMAIIKPELHSVAYFSPIPGSDLYEYCKSRDLIRVESNEGFVRNPVNKKIKGVDYKIIARYKDKISRHCTPWWKEGYFMRHVLRRWIFLIKRGYIKEFFLEFAVNFPGMNLFMAFLSRMRKKL